MIASEVFDKFDYKNNLDEISAVSNEDESIEKPNGTKIEPQI